VPAIALAVGQVPAVREEEPARCRRTALVAQVASVIALSHQVPGWVRVATLLVAVGLGAISARSASSRGGASMGGGGFSHGAGGGGRSGGGRGGGGGRR
jgi:uncharacterized membrane protein YgcG